MIDIKYKRLYDEFIKKYKEIHVNPWHEINKIELNKIYNFLVNSMDIDNEYNFKYFMDYIIKKLSGPTDAHTKYQKVDLLPLNFRMFNNNVLINYPKDMRGYELVSINGVSIQTIINEFEDIITYGTEGKRTYEIEKSLFNKLIMFGLPSFRNTEQLDYEIKDHSGNIIKRSFKKKEQYGDMFDYDEYQYGNNGNYRLIDNCLVYNHSSVQNKFKETIENSINNLRQEDLSNVDSIIIDLRGNWGGNSALNKILMDFIEEHKDKILICLTDYRVFSGGRYALRDLINLGAVTIGEEISTPINCYGNSNWINLEDHYFSISESYFNPFMNSQATTKEEYIDLSEEVKKPIIFHPDIIVEQTKDDYINGIDTILEYALKYIKSRRNGLSI